MSVPSMASDPYGPPPYKPLPYEPPPYNLPPPTWEPPPEVPGVFKFVPIQFCIVDDGRINAAARRPDKALGENPGFPGGRFNAGNLLIGLIWKNLIIGLQAGVFFVPQGPALFIDDPHPNRRPWTEGGELGDVAKPKGGYCRQGDIQGVSFPMFGPPNRVSPAFVTLLPVPSPAAQPIPPGDVQLQAVRNACDMHPNRIQGAILEVLIRRFVDAVDDDGDGRIDEDTLMEGTDFDGDGDDGEDRVRAAETLGKSATPPCSFEPSPLPAPTTVDPENFARLGLFGFGVTMAHENGHALCLTHFGAPANLMFPFLPALGPPGIELLDFQVRLLRAQAQHYAKTRDKDAVTGETIVRDGPVTARVVDPMGDAPGPAVDITGVAVAKRADGSLGLLTELAGVLPKGLAGARYTFAVDVDGDPATGALHRSAAAGRLEGADLRITIDVGTKDGKATIGHLVERATADGWTDTAAPHLGLRLEPVIFDGKDEPDVPLNHTLLVVVPYSDLPTPLAEGFRVLAEASDGKAHDTVPVVIGSVTPIRYDDAPTLRLDPLRVPFGGRIAVYGSNYRPGAQVPVFAGRDLVRTVTVGPDGRFETEIKALPRVNGASIVSPGNALLPIMAIDPQGGGDGMVVTVTPDQERAAPTGYP